MPLPLVPHEAEKITTTAELKASFHLLASPRFGTFWVASFLSSIGTWSQSVAEPWLLLSLGASPFILGLDNFATNAPVWLLTLLGGVLADTRDRRSIITFFQSIQMLCPLAIAAFLFFNLPINPYWIIGLSVIVGVTDALSMPSFQSIVPSLVEHDQIARGLALNSTQMNLSRILGPALAGILISSVGAFACFAISAASYIPFIGAALFALPRLDPKQRPKRQQHSLSKDMKKIAGFPELRVTLLIVLVNSVLCGPLIIFSPILIKDVFSGEVGHFSMAVGAFGAGGLMGGVALLGAAQSHHLRRFSLWAALTYGLILACLGLTKIFWTVPLLMAMAGFCMAVSSIAANATIQSKVEPELLGQSASLFALATRGGLPLGSLMTGFSVEYIGIQNALLVNGIAAITLQLLIAAWGGVKSRHSRTKPPA